MKKPLLSISMIISLFCLCYEIKAQVIKVPDDHSTIQMGIYAAKDGDTVLVAPGKYFENLNMAGKNILLASWFETTGELDYINQTIINGGQPNDSDSASCILIVSGENENCVIAGFTITGGKGTRWEDEHNPGGYFTEGGGILIQYSSPTIRNNVIRDNVALTRNVRNVSAGGGAIRMGDSNPRIVNNFIHHNQGRYGGGIVLNYSGGEIRNNLITNNSGGQDFGGGGLWILGNSTEPCIVENNTIVNNSSTNLGGGIRIWMSTVILTNNVIRGNHGTSGAQVHGTGIWTYCNIEGGKVGEGNIDEIIRFNDPLFYLPDGDLSIDAGNPHVSYNDPEDSENDGFPLYPSKGTLRNDMGAYGGPGAMGFPEPDLSGIAVKGIKTGFEFKMFPNPAHNYLKVILSPDISFPLTLEIFNMLGQSLISFQLFAEKESFEIDLEGIGIRKGVFIIKMRSKNEIYTKRVLVN